MDIITDPKQMRAYADSVKAGGGSVGFVPTMGYLHEGHLSLIRAARGQNSAVIVSIFVNPTQFGPNEDLGRYPRDTDGDIAKCRAEDADAVFMPPESAMYPEGATTFVDLAGEITNRLCGGFRPGHFRGVATVVAKLFNIVNPDRAYFGSKDYQQTVVIKRMAHDLDFPVEVVVLPTVRELDGLAMSSRNAYLSPEERTAAGSIYRALSHARTIRSSGETSAERIAAEVTGIISSEPLARIEYVAVVEPDDLSPATIARAGTVLAVAVRVGGTRLIDNAVL